MKKAVFFFILSIPLFSSHDNQSEKNNILWQTIASKILQKERWHEVLCQYKSLRFAEHLIEHFGKDTIEDLVIAAQRLPEHQFKQAENTLNLACDNFHASQSFPQVDPAGKTILEYIDQLKNTDN